MLCIRALHALQLIEEKNKTGIPENVNFLTADIEQMYPKVPWNLCEIGVAEYSDSRRMEPGQPSTENVIKCLRICQENNLFEFKDDLYKQKEGHTKEEMLEALDICQENNLFDITFRRGRFRWDRRS